MLYRITETTFGPAGEEPDITVNLSDTESTPIDRPDYTLSCTPLTVEEVGLEELICAVESAYENGNHTGRLYSVSLLLQYVKAAFPDEAVKMMLWTLVNDHGLAW